MNFHSLCIGNKHILLLAQLSLLGSFQLCQPVQAPDNGQTAGLRSPARRCSQPSRGQDHSSLVRLAVEQGRGLIYLMLACAVLSLAV